jgi:hypothetical protein
MQWFRNIQAGTPFSAGATSLDYSLQLATGIQNLAAWSNTCNQNPEWDARKIAARIDLE